MDFDFSDKVRDLQKKVGAFMDAHIYPNENRFFEEIEENRRKGNAWIPTRVIEDLKPKARAAGLWNLWRPKDHGGALTNLEYAPMCEIMGHLAWAPEVFNCSAILVPADAKGVKVARALSVFGYDDAPHGHMEVTLENVRVPATNLLLGEGRGFEIAQGRLGPGRIHHCMRIIGQAERALEFMCKRLKARVAFGRPVAEQSVWHERIAESRIMIEQARLLTLKAAFMMDTVGNKEAKAEIAMIKVIAPTMAQQVIDWAIQAHGGGGVCQDFPLSWMYALNRTLRLADGPDEVHRNQIARLELKKNT